METTNNKRNSSVAAIDDYRQKSKKVQAERERTSSFDFRHHNDCAILEYYTAKTGTYIVKSTAKGEEYDVRVSAAQIKILSALKTDRKLYVSLEIIVGDGEKNIVSIPLSAIKSIQKRSEETAAYHDAGGDPDKNLGATLYEIAVMLIGDNKIQTIAGYENPGWYLNNHVRVGDDTCVSSINARRPVKTGDFDKWLEAVNSVISDQIKAQTIMSFAAGSYLRGLSGFSVDNSNIISLHSLHTSTGKTSMLQILQSIESDTLISDASSTLAATEEILASHSSGFACIDELHSLIARERNPVERLMSWGNGGGRGKKSATGAPAAVWNTSIFTTANIAISDISANHAQHEALMARTFEFDFEKGKTIFTQPDAARRLKSCGDVLSENYGLAYEKIIDAIKDYTSADKAYTLRDLFNTFIEQSFEAAEENGALVGEFSRKAKSCALAYCGAVILEAIGLTVDSDGVYDELMSMLLGEIKKTVANKEEEFQNLKSDISNMIAAMFQHIRVDGYLAIDDDSTKDLMDGITITLARDKQKRAAETHNQSIRKMLGIIKQNAVMDEAMNFNGSIFISSSAADLIKKESGLELSNIVARAKRAGVLELTQSSIDQGILQITNRTLGRGYKLSLTDIPF